MKLKGENFKWMIEYRSIPKESSTHPMAYHKLNLTGKKNSKKNPTLLARNRGDDLASPMSSRLIAKKALYILITLFFLLPWNVLGYWKQRCFQSHNKK